MPVGPALLAAVAAAVAGDIRASQTVIREATADDVPALVAMGQRFRNSTVYARRLRDNPEQMAETGLMLIHSDDGLLLVADRGGAPIGMIGVLVFPHHLSGERTAGELFFWVDPEYRGYGVRLLRQAERWARERGATTMQMIAPVVIDEPDDDVGPFYARVGYHALEVAYEKDLTCL